MTHKERFHATIDRKPVDRPASWLGLPVPDALPGLFEYFNVFDVAGLRCAVDDDVYPVEMPCNFPGSNAIYSALQFAKKGLPNSERTLTAPGFFEDYDDPSRIDDFNWPDPEKYIDPEECLAAVEAADDRAVVGILWSAHFQDACSAFGMEASLVKMLEEPDMYVAVINRITQFYLKANKIFYEATKGKVDAVLIGNDFGSQTGLMLSPALINEFVIPGTVELINQAKSYGLKVIYHSCGAIIDAIPALIGAGVDVIHPIQALASKMDPDILRERFGSMVSFCGGVDAQYLLVTGSPDEVKTKVRQLKSIFPTGLIISPSHEAILPDINPANIKALFEAIHE
jgi:uroporphyrinogen decarboxylase